MKPITIKVRSFGDLEGNNWMRLDCVENGLNTGIKLRKGQKIPTAEIIGKRVLALIAFNESDKVKIPLPKVEP